MPNAVRLIEGCKELRQRHAQGARQSVDDIQRGRLPPSLQITQVGPVQASAVGQVFLRQAEATSQLPDSRPQRRPQIVHAGIVPSERLPQP
jgi:hypothetical protein